MEIKQEMRCLKRSHRLLMNTDKEEIDPRFPVSVGAYAEHQVSISALMLLEVPAEIEQGLRQDALFAQLERNEYPSHSPVAIHERMDGLELIVDERQMNQERKPTLTRPDVLLQVIEGCSHFNDRWWNESSGLGGCARVANKDGFLPELAGAFVLPTNARHQALMDLTHQALTNGHGFQQIEAEFKRRDIIGDFADIRAPVVCGRIDLVQQELLEPGRRPFDAAGQHCFLSQEGVDQQVGIRQISSHPSEFSQGALCFSEEIDRLEFKAQGGGEWRGNEGEMPARILNQFPWRVRRE